MSAALSRRALLAATAAAGALATVPFVGRLALAAPGSAGAREGCLVVVFLRGGADGLMLVGPTNDPTYTAARPPDLRVLDAGDRAGLRLANSLDPHLDFRFHHELGPLAELYDAKALAVIHAAGITDGTRSHFVAQDLIERGVAAEGELTRTHTGWLGRLVDAVAKRDPRAGPARAVCTAGAVDASLAGYGGALAVPDLAGGIGFYGGDATRNVLAALYRGGDDALARGVRTAVATIGGLDQRLPRGPDGKPLLYQPENQATYDGELGRGLRVVAQLLKMEVGLTLAAIDMGGWDTHEGQPGRFANQAHQLGAALGAFWNDVARFHDRVTVIVLTEFG
ncbi:MAG: DUF1501 domain-containing protein, partial [Alphaproteobacteria bacterium]|nr:DUF1501 domain-containing protein [Alphaproteobacteria bacterium]